MPLLLILSFAVTKSVNTILQFLIPYLQLCYLAAWGIAQNLEGLGLFTALNSQPIEIKGQLVFPLVLDASRGVMMISLLLTAFLIYVLLSSIRAGFYLGRKIGVAAIVVWLVPGLLSLMGVAFNLTQYGPPVFRFGLGFTGGAPSAGANLLLFLLAGWSTMMMLGARWKRDTFKNTYDHVWYALGLIAALYFVVDSGKPFYQEDLDDAHGRTEKLLAIYAASTSQLTQACEVDINVQSLARGLCARSKELAWRIKSDSELGRKVRPSIDLGDWGVRLLLTPSMSAEIDSLNAWACGQDRNRYCQKFPVEVARDTKAYDIGHAFPPNAYLDSLKAYRTAILRAHEQVESTERGHNIRYFAFLVIAFLAGGKVANASRALRAPDLVRPHSWVMICLNMCLNAGCRLLRIGLACIKAGANAIKRISLSLADKLRRLAMSIQLSKRKAKCADQDDLPGSQE
jgi:hypothetical protein